MISPRLAEAEHRAEHAAADLKRWVAVYAESGLRVLAGLLAIEPEIGHALLPNAGSPERLVAMRLDLGLVFTFEQGRFTLVPEHPVVSVTGDAAFHDLEVRAREEVDGAGPFATALAWHLDTVVSWDRVEVACDHRVPALLRMLHCARAMLERRVSFREGAYAASTWGLDLTDGVDAPSVRAFHAVAAETDSDMEASFLYRRGRNPSWTMADEIAAREAHAERYAAPACRELLARYQIVA